jgi:hypothetical protein
VSRSTDLFIADVIGDLSSGANKARLKHMELAFADEPNEENSIAETGTEGVAKNLLRKRETAKTDTKLVTEGLRPNGSDRIV